MSCWARPHCHPPRINPLSNAMKLVEPEFECVSREDISRWRGQRWTQEQDQLAVEVPVALEFNGISHAVMLATPSDLESFALGFALSEGIVENRAEFRDAEVTVSQMGITVHCEIASSAFMRLKQRRRNMTGRTGCGLCGVESLEQVVRQLPAVPRGASVPVLAMRAALKAVSYTHLTLPTNRE